MASDPDRDPEAEREQRILQVLDAYLRAVESGEELDRSRWLAQHPELADELARFLDEQDRLMRLTEPLRPIAAALSLDAWLATTLAEPPGDPIEDGPAEPGGAGSLGTGAAVAAAGARLRRFGDYELIEPIALGGMGAVFKARQRSLNRLVALKIIRSAALATNDDLLRFRQESEAIARLDHRNIVPIYEVGEHEGFSFFSMKLADGGSLARRMTEYTADPRSAARLVAAVARAIHHAHQRGILHRDLKPSNILLDDLGQPYVADFGLAKWVEGDSELTQSGAILGTPSYMAPEQASGQKGAVTTATDVYGLGAVLYSLLSGRPPFQGDSVLETLEQVRQQMPEPPSGVGRQGDRDLETISLKCLEKEPQRRYRSAQELAEDLERWLGGELIAARRARPFERAWRWCRRNPRAATLLAGMAMLALIATVGFIVALNAREAVAQVNRDLLRRERLFQQKQYVAAIQQASYAIEANQVAEAVDLLARHRPAPGAEDPRGFEWYYLWRLCHLGGRTLRGHQGDVYHAEFSPDGTVLATSGRDRTVRLWDVATGATRVVLTGHSDEVNCVAFAPDGRTLATASEDQTVKVWDVATGRERRTLSGHRAEVVSTLFTPDGRRLVSHDRDGYVFLWDAATGRRQSSFRTRDEFDEAMAISPDGTTLAVAGGGAGLWDLATGRQKRILDEGPAAIFSVVFSRDGKHLAATRDKDIRGWDTQTGESWFGVKGNVSTLYSVAMTPDERWVAWADTRGLVEIWDWHYGYAGKIPTGQDRVWSAAFAPDCRTLATASRDGTVKLWDIARDKDRYVIPVGSQEPRSLAFSADGRTMTAVGVDGTVWTCDTHGGQFRSTQRFAFSEKVLQVELSRDAATLAALSHERTCQVWDVQSGRSVLLIKDGIKNGIRLSPDGTWLSADWETEPGQYRIRIWNTENGQASMVGAPGPIGLWTFTPDQRRLAWIESSSGSPRFADRVSGRTWNASGPGHVGGILTLEFSADGKTLATAGFDRAIRLWDVDPLQEPLTLRGSKGGVFALSFSGDGKTLASLDGANTITLWDIAAGELDFILGPIPHPMNDLRFAPDGSALATRGLGIVQGRWIVYVWPAPRTD